MKNINRSIECIALVLLLITQNAAGTEKASADSIDLGSRILLVINNERFGLIPGASVIDAIIPGERIASTNVIRDSAALFKYGDLARNGAIEIQLKDTNNNDIIYSEKWLSYDIIFETLEIWAAFPGGESKLKHFVERNLKWKAPDPKPEPGAYSVIVEFIVDKEGKIHNLRALSNHGYGMEEAALKLIQSGPKWFPGIHAGRQVVAFKRLAIGFNVN